MQKKRPGLFSRLKRKLKRFLKKLKGKHIPVMNVVLIVIGISLLVFTVRMIQLFEIYGSIPDTLVTCVFAALAGECGIMGWIKTSKDRKRERNWELEDRKAREEPSSQADTAADQPRNNL